MTSELYYFSGTGNSLFAARELAKRLPGSGLLPMAAALRGDSPKTEAPVVGFVFPTYLASLPVPVRRFLERLDVSSANYIFSVVTRAGTFTTANEAVERLLEGKGRRLDARFLVDFPDNSPTGLKPGKGNQAWAGSVAPAEAALLDAAAVPLLDEAAGIVAARRRFPEKPSRSLGPLLAERLLTRLTGASTTAIGFSVDSSCSGCGTCMRVCPAEKVRLRDGRPEWRREADCFHCYACFNFCPNQAVLVRGKYEKKDGRYVHTGITAGDIAGQKNQGPSACAPGAGS